MSERFDAVVGNGRGRGLQPLPSRVQAHQEQEPDSGFPYHDVWAFMYAIDEDGVTVSEAVELATSFNLRLTVGAATTQGKPAPLLLVDAVRPDGHHLALIICTVDPKGVIDKAVLFSYVGEVGEGSDS